MSESKSELKIAIVVNPHVLDVIDNRASKVWHSQAGNRSALTRNIVTDWGYNQEANSKRGSLVRLEEYADKSAIVLDEILTILRRNEREHVIGLVTAALTRCGVDVSTMECVLQELAE